MKKKKNFLPETESFIPNSTQIRPTRVFFLSSFSPNFDDQLSSNFQIKAQTC